MIALKLFLTAAILTYVSARNIDSLKVAITGKPDSWSYVTGIFVIVMFASALTAIWQL